MHCKRYQGSMREDRLSGIEGTQDSMGMKSWHEGGARNPHTHAKEFRSGTDEQERL